MSISGPEVFRHVQRFSVQARALGTRLELQSPDQMSTLWPKILSQDQSPKMNVKCRQSGPEVFKNTRGLQSRREAQSRPNANSPGQRSLVKTSSNPRAEIFSQDQRPSPGQTLIVHARGLYSRPELHSPVQMSKPEVF